MAIIIFCQEYDTGFLTCVEEAIRRKDGNREAAARLLGIKPHTFRKQAREKFGL
ncbi:MAG: helix-turn-helix domain-containing protein [Syntrophales bacterium]